MKKLKLLDQSIFSNYGRASTVAIVGNGGITEKEQRQIDKCDIVVRFNNYATRKDIAKTTNPLKCDILFSTFDLRSEGDNPKDVVIGIPFPFHAKQVAIRMDKWYAESRQWMVNPFLNMKMCQDMDIDSLGSSHPLPSIGFTALWHIYQMPMFFYVFGFNWYFNPENGKFQGWDIENDNYPRHWNHNYIKEVRWIVANLMGKHNIIFSEPCLNILEYAKKKLDERKQ